MARPTTLADRAPAESGRRALERVRHRALASLVVGSFALMASVAAVAAGEPAGAIFWLALGTAFVLAADRVLPQLGQRRRGIDGEVAVADALTVLEAHGWFVLHDVDTGRGNIDHVVVGPGGVFTVETKSRAGRRKVDQIDPAWLAQAYARAVVEPAEARALQQRLAGALG